VRSNFRKIRAGQVTLLALLLGVLGLTVGLSVASRSLSDLKQASYVDFGTKALAAAEAGAEYGLYWQSLNPNDNSKCSSLGGVPLDVKAITSSASWNLLNIKSIFVDVCPDPNVFLSKDVGSDDVLQANMTGLNGNSSYSVLWQNGPATAQAMEVTVLYLDYSIKRYAYNSQSASGAPWTGNNFLTAGTPPASSASCPTAGLGNVSGAIPATNGGGGNYVIQIRAKPLGGQSVVQICGSSALQSQRYIVTSAATTNNNVTKKIQVTRENNGTLPSVFDNVIFSGGNLNK
jgi:hypothetical protein